MEQSLVLALNSLGPTRSDGVIAFVSDWGAYLYPLVLLVCLAVTRTRKSGATLRGGWLAFFVALLVSDTILKPIVRRPRPTAIHALVSHLHVLGKAPPAGNFSFPSGAATACAAGATWIWLRFGPRWGALAAMFAVFVSVSRVYAGLHWPSDVLFGGVLGVGVAVGVARFERWLDAQRA